jgi:hypothetical protein
MVSGTSHSNAKQQDREQYNKKWVPGAKGS